MLYAIKFTTGFNKKPSQLKKKKNASSHLLISPTLVPEPSHFENIKVSTSFSFITTLTSPFSPSNAQFQEPNGATLFGSLLQFLHETVSIIVTETGWPSSSAAANEFDTNLGYAEIYLKGLLICMHGGCGGKPQVLLSVAAHAIGLVLMPPEPLP